MLRVPSADRTGYEMRTSVLASVAVAATALATASVGGGSATAAAARPSFKNVKVTNVAEAFRPAALGGSRQVTVSVTVGTAPSVATRQTSFGRSLNKSERRAVRTAVRKSQSGVRRVVVRHHGRVIREMADAVNALTVRVPRSALPALAAAPGVSKVVPVRIVRMSNTAADLYTGVAQAWEGAGRTGTGVKVAVIDTGLDYYHADFGGSGDPAEFANDDGTVREPGTFPTAKVIAGHDFVGDDYDSASTNPAINTPKPDDDPLDCNGHGSHVAGTAAGFGVTAAGATYHGPYNESALRTGNLKIGPGTAPNASLMAYRVFGCEGSATDADVAAAIDQAVRDGADVINMSLGETFGGADGLDTMAADAAALAGVVVVASAGNEGPSAYVAGSPGTAARTLGVAALDASLPSFPAASIDTTPATKGLVANGVAISTPITALVKVVGDATSIGLGCDAADYANTAGAIVVTLRGVCDRIARAKFGQASGAVAVIMVNSGPGLPPFEGAIEGVTIPFIGMPGDAAAALLAANKTQHTISDAGVIANPTYGFAADFTSAGPRNDSVLKPDVAAPGVSLVSVGAGTGTGTATISGTSMASPHTAGIAALVVEAHPDWAVASVKASIMNTATADPALVHDYDPTRLGAGLVQPGKAVSNTVLAETEDGLDNLSFGYEAADGGFSETRTLTLRNTGSASRVFDLAAAYTSPTLGSEISISPSTVRVGAGDTARVRVTIRMSRSDVAALPNAEASDGGDLVSTRGVVTATPESSDAGVFALRIPFLLVPRGLSDIEADARVRRGAGEIRLRNNGVHAGSAELYAFGARDARDAPGPTDLRAIGVESLPGEVLEAGAADRALVFAVNTYERWGNPGETEIDVLVDTDGDGSPDFIVAGVDLGLVTAGVPNGIFVSFTFRVVGDEIELVNAWNTIAPMNSSTALLPVLASDLGLTEAAGDFTYTAAASSVISRGTPDQMDGTGAFNAFRPAQSTGQFVSLNPGERARVPVTGHRRAAWMVVSFDDENGPAQADIVRARRE
jgi:subtilisin family serine protease